MVAVVAAVDGGVVVVVVGGGDTEVGDIAVVVFAKRRGRVVVPL